MVSIFIEVAPQVISTTAPGYFHFAFSLLRTDANMAISVMRNRFSFAVACVLALAGCSGNPLPGNICSDYAYLESELEGFEERCYSELAKSQAQASILVARRLLEIGSQEEGAGLLQRAADFGSDEANYWLGWVHVGEILDNYDKRKGLEFLGAVEKEYKVRALTLIGGVYAEGFDGHSADADTARQKFQEALSLLLAQWDSGNQNSKPTDAEETKETIERTEKLYIDAAFLRGTAEKHGILLFMPI